MVCHMRRLLETKVVILAPGMLALYMRFNGTGILVVRPLYTPEIRTKWSPFILFIPARFAFSIVGLCFLIFVLRIYQLG